MTMAEPELTKEERAQRLVRELIIHIGDDPDREGLKDTPKRVIKSYKEFFAGYSMNAEKILGTTFEKGKYDQMIVCRNIELYSTCEHHMVPFFGTAHVGYIPGDRVVGLSKLARVVDVFARRLQIQEQLTEQVAETIDKVLAPRGVMVVIAAKHMCMCARGVGKQKSSMVTSAIRGVFKDAQVRAEFFNLVEEK